MHTRADHLELLALIEDELDTATAAQLRQRLASEPRVLEMIERIRHDRVSLRSLGEVQVPTDVLDQLETLLARPMLAEPLEPATSASVGGNGVVYSSPGQYRRQYRRQALRLRWRRIAAAAVIFIALIGGTWAAMNGLNRAPGGNDERTLAMSDTSSPAVDALDDARAIEALSGTIHHALSPLAPSRTMTALRGSTPAPSTASSTGAAKVGTPQFIVADFALVVQTSDVPAMEESFTSVAAQMKQNVTLVRNFSFAEAAKIAQEVRVARGGRHEPDHDPAAASTRGPGTRTDLQLKSLADTVRQQINSSASRRSSSETSGPISGSLDLAPSLEQQLDFSSRGATHSVAVTVLELNSFLERAATAHDQSTSLRMLPARDSAMTSDALHAWVTDRESLQQAFERLRSASPDTVVVIPVVVQTK